MSSDCADDDMWTPPPAKKARGGGATLTITGLEGINGLSGGDGAAAPPQTVGLAEIQDELGCRKKKCWGCEFFFLPESRAEDKEIWGLWDHYKRDKSLLTEAALFQSVADYHYKKIYLPRKNTNLSTYEWDARMVEAHFMVHDLNPKDDFADRFRSLRDMRMWLKSELFVVDPVTGKKSSNDKKWLLYFKAEEKITTLVNTNLDRIPEKL